MPTVWPLDTFNASAAGSRPPSRSLRPWTLGQKLIESIWCSSAAALAEPQQRQLRLGAWMPKSPTPDHREPTPASTSSTSCCHARSREEGKWKLSFTPVAKSLTPSTWRFSSFSFAFLAALRETFRHDLRYTMGRDGPLYFSRLGDRGANTGRVANAWSRRRRNTVQPTGSDQRRQCRTPWRCLDLGHRNAARPGGHADRGQRRALRQHQLERGAGYRRADRPGQVEMGSGSRSLLRAAPLLRRGQPRRGSRSRQGIRKRVRRTAGCTRRCDRETALASPHHRSG